MLKDLASLMLEELQSSYLEVAKVPSAQGGYIRVPVSVNAEWYCRFCRMYVGRNRRYPKRRTLICRQHTIKALQRIICGETSGVYVGRLIDFMWRFYQEELSDGRLAVSVCGVEATY